MFEMQSQPAEIEAMRVFAQPLDVFGLGLVPIAQRRIVAGAAFHFERHLRLLDGESLGIRKTVPAPLRLCQQRHQWRVLILEGLQTGDIGREPDAAVAHHERRRGIHGGDGGAVSFHERLTIDGRGQNGHGKKQYQARGHAQKRFHRAVCLAGQPNKHNCHEANTPSVCQPGLTRPARHDATR
jgi:hypothetical protein